MISYLYRDRTVPGSLQRLENTYCLRHCFSLGNIIHLKIEQAHAENELAALQKQQEELQEEADRIGTGEYMEQQARDWLKMAKQGEIIYEFDGDNDGSAGSSGSVIKESGDEEKENQ